MTSSDNNTKAELRSAFASFMTGVTVVTTVSESGAPVGFTANSFTSVSLDPPLLLVCPGKTLSSFSVFEDCENFVVNILAEDQQDIANLFATPDTDRFSNIAWHKDAAGCPLIEGTAVHFSCSAHQRVEAGDHIVLIGRINEFSNSGCQGLGYSKDGYFSLGRERRAQEYYATQRPVVTGVIIEHNGQVLLYETAAGMVLPQVATNGMQSSIAELYKLLERENIEVDFGPIYSNYENSQDNRVYIYHKATSKSLQTSCGGKYFPLTTINQQKFADPAVATMLKRYTEEYERDDFGQYLGDEQVGRVQTLK